MTTLINEFCSSSALFLVLLFFRIKENLIKGSLKALIRRSTNPNVTILQSNDSFGIFNLWTTDKCHLSWGDVAKLNTHFSARLKFIPLCKSQGPLKMLKITGLMFLVYVINMQRYRPHPQRPELVPGRCFEHSCKSITGS